MTDIIELIVLTILMTLIGLSIVLTFAIVGELFLAVTVGATCLLTVGGLIAANL